MGFGSTTSITTKTHAIVCMNDALLKNFVENFPQCFNLTSSLMLITALEMGGQSRLARHYILIDVCLVSRLKIARIVKHFKRKVTKHQGLTKQINS